MNYIHFKSEFFKEICISKSRIESEFENFNFNNISRWINKNLLIRLRNGLYAFPEYLEESNIRYYLANRIYRPSYVSLQSALSYYGLIPEAVIQIKSITSLKTNAFENRFGIFTYNTIKPDYFFGYQQKALNSDFTFLIAEPEKAILDLLYIYSFYNTSEEITELRLNKEILNEIVNRNKLTEYAKRYRNKALSNRLNLLIKNYFDVKPKSNQRVFP